MRSVWLSILALLLAATACAGERPTFEDIAACEVDAAGGDLTDQAPDLVLRIAVPSPFSMDPAVVDPVSVTNRVIADLLYEGLVSLDDANSPTPALADHWFVDDDRTTWTFVLADDLADADGVPLTARDVRRSLERVAAQGRRAMPH